MSLPLPQIAFYALGAGASVEDMARRKVANLWIAGGLLVGAAVLMYLGLNTAMGESHRMLWGLGELYLPPSFYVKAAVHFLLSAAAAVALWYLRVWPAGDAKLYIVLSSLLILIDHSLRGFPSWLFLVALINIFVMAGCFVLGVVLCEWAGAARRMTAADARREAGAVVSRLRRRFADEWGKRANYAVLSWNTIVLFLAFSAALSALRLRLASMSHYLAVYFALYLAWRWLRLILLRKDVFRLSFFIVTFVVAPVAAYFRWDLLRDFLASIRMTLGFDFFLVAFQRVVDWYLRAARRRKVALDELEEGMILTENNWDQMMRGATRYADGLSSEDIRLIQGAGGAGELSVYWHRPFALWIFLGCLWTLYINENVVQWLTRLAHR